MFSNYLFFLSKVGGSIYLDQNLSCFDFIIYIEIENYLFFFRLLCLICYKNSFFTLFKSSKVMGLKIY